MCVVYGRHDVVVDERGSYCYEIHSREIHVQQEIYIYERGVWDAANAEEICW